MHDFGQEDVESANISVKVRMHGFNVDGLLHPSLEPSRLRGEDCSVIHLNCVVRLFYMDVFRHFRGRGTGSSMFVEPGFQ